MKTLKPNSAKDSYKHFRTLSWDRLWTHHVPEFNEADARTRFENAGLIRAVGVVFMETASRSNKNEVATWLRELLKDSDEKIRRYAMAALPKIGADQADEAALIDLVKSTNPNERETRHLARALDKIGGEATLDIAHTLPLQTRQKVQANLARDESPTRILINAPACVPSQTKIHLRCRRGLEGLVRNEFESSTQSASRFSVTSQSSGLVEVVPRGPFRLADLLEHRCFASLAFVLGIVKNLDARSIAKVIAAPTTHTLLSSLTEGVVRYRLEFPAHGHQRGLVKEIAALAFEACPALLNDSRQAPWVVEIHPHRGAFSIEVRPRFSPDPRFSYRRRDVPAASHPPLAAAMARLAGNSGNDVVWDPFCGSGLELIERGLCGGVRKLIGSDLSASALEIAKSNLNASNLLLESEFLCGDFRKAAPTHESVTQIITNPPMGRRVPIPNLEGLIRDLLATSLKALQPRGVLVFANPLPSMHSLPGLKIDLRQRIDLGGFDVHLERHIKSNR